MSKTKKIIKEKKLKKKVIHQYSEEALALALQSVRNNQLKIRQASRVYNVLRGAIQDRLHGRVKEGPRKMGPSTAISTEEEGKLSNWICELAKAGFPRKKDDVLNTVEQLIIEVTRKEDSAGKENKRKIPFKNNRPGNKWYYNFLARHPEISVREPETLTKSRESVTEEYIRKWFQDLNQYLKDNNYADLLDDPSRILNGDETSFSLCPKSGKVLAPKGWKNVYEIKKGSEKETLTVMMVFTASVTPMIVYPYIRPPKTVIDSVPSNWFIGRTESGWMRAETFYEYIANGVHNWLNEKEIRRPVLLFVDGHKSHLTMKLSQFCSNHGIILYALPPNCTHLIQPADVSVFKPLKSHWKQTVRQWQSLPENTNMVINKTVFAPLLEAVLNEHSLKDAIINGFKKCGLYPFNPNAVDYSKCVQNRLEYFTNIQGPKVTEQEIKNTIEVLNKLEESFNEKGVDISRICDLLNGELKKIQNKDQAEMIQVETYTVNDEGVLLLETQDNAVEFDKQNVQNPEEFEDDNLGVNNLISFANNEIGEVMCNLDENSEYNKIFKLNLTENNIIEDDNLKESLLSSANNKLSDVENNEYSKIELNITENNLIKKRRNKDKIEDNENKGGTIIFEDQKRNSINEVEETKIQDEDENSNGTTGKDNLEEEEIEPEYTNNANKKNKIPDISKIIDIDKSSKNENHFFWPAPLEKSKTLKKVTEKQPAALSSRQFKEFLQKKIDLKREKIEQVKKRKEARMLVEQKKAKKRPLS